MRNLIALTVIATLGGCVSSDTAVEYAERAHPECDNHVSLNHQLASTSQTEVQMTCEDTKRSITVKCIFGWGIISDTTCHENN